MEWQKIFAPLLANDNPLVILETAIILALASCVVYQWLHTTKNTVPKWIWDTFVVKVDLILKSQESLTTIVNERLRPKQ